MQFKFPYIRGWPMIMAKLRNMDGKERYFEFLVDSGSDYTLISQDDARLIGVEYKDIKQKDIPLETANFAPVQAKKISLIITIENKDFMIPVLISKSRTKPLLGRKGVFYHFDVLFQENREQVVFISRT